MSTATDFQQRLRALDADRYCRGAHAEEDFAYACRDAALRQAKKGNFSEAFRIITVIESEGIESENDTLWSDFYMGIAKAILVHQNIAFEALKGDQRRQLKLQNIIRQLSQPEKIINFLETCRLLGPVVN